MLLWLERKHLSDALIPAPPLRIIRPFTVWSRLTYCMYLVHPAVIYWMYNSMQGPIHYSSIW
jgi:hypothetical protein